MVKSAESCLSLQTSAEKRWPYEEYYFGETDRYGRKNGQGEQHWTGAESLEWYIGPMLHDTMHGNGDYRWRYKDPDGSFVTYEGRFFANQMHGYGVMSYPDGRVFTGLFHKDIRWGPGLERHTNLKSNVGFWRGPQLARLCWRPPGPTIAPNLVCGSRGPDFLNPYRIILIKNVKMIGETNPALELLKWYGSNPVEATKKWEKLYPTYCTDVNSELLNKDLFDYKYYGKKIKSLIEAGTENKKKFVAPDDDNRDHEDDDKGKDEIEEDEASCYFSWNNNEMLLHMMKHCYMHEIQRAKIRLNLRDMLCGNRKKFRPAAAHELNCRSLLLASFNGHISMVAQLVNEKDVYADLADSLGNSALMYATCGDQTVVIHFLVEAGANINSYNDSCCTPLGVALLRYLCVANNITPRSAMMASVLPPKKDHFSHVAQRNNCQCVEWQITREVTQDIVVQIQTDIKLAAVSSGRMKKTKSFPSAQTFDRKLSKLAINAVKPQKKEKDEEVYDSDDEMFSDEKNLFLLANREYCSTIAELFAPPTKVKHTSIAPYLFTVRDMVKDIDAVQEKKHSTIRITESKVLGNNEKKNPLKVKSTKVSLNKIESKIKEPEFDEIDDPGKLEMLSKIHLTITQLLADGADPTLVTCPQPAILLAMKSGSLEIVKHMVTYGANVNEKFPKLLNYTVLDMIILEPFSNDNLEMMRTLLELGADTRHRLKIEDATNVHYHEPGWIDGPTLLHAVVMKETEFQFEEDIKQNEIQALLQYNADPTAQYKGRSPIDCAMRHNLRLLETFIQHPATNLNSIINDENHTILVKLFSREYFMNNRKIYGFDKTPILTSLLLYGADPLIECYDADIRFANLFEFTQKTLYEISPRQSERRSSARQSADLKAKSKNEINKSKSVLNAIKSSKMSKMKLLTEDGRKKDKGPGAEYRDALNLIREYTRVLYVRWLQGKLLKELVNVIYRFKHRHWTMIIKEHKNAHVFGNWVNSVRCLEIWDFLKNTNNRKYKDETILKKLLCIVEFYQKIVKTDVKVNMKITPITTAADKNEIETVVGLMIRDYKIGRLTSEAEVRSRSYVKPELARVAHKKFKVCFECFLPIDDTKIVCDFCGLVLFCNLDCMTDNLYRFSGHPCNEKLREKYLSFSPDEESSWLDDVTSLKSH